MNCAPLPDVCLDDVSVLFVDPKGDRMAKDQIKESKKP